MAVPNNGGEFQEYQSAQNQLLNIQAQQMQNLNEQKIMAQADASTNNVLYQASGLMADNMMNNTQEAANFNPQTQAILNQYGLGQPRMQRSSSSSSQSTSKQNITINNNYKTENTTNNNVTVHSGGPIQGRPVTTGDNGIGKFKVWLNTAFAKQQEEAAKRDRYYEIRQANLSKDNNKILRKLETVGTNVGKALDPRNITQTVQNPIKMLFTTLGIVTIAKSWPKIMDFVDSAQNFFKPGGTFAQLLGGEDGESVGESFKNLFFDEDTGLISHLKLWLKQEGEKRRIAIKNVSEIERDVLGIPKVSDFGRYIGDMLKAIVSPEESIESSASKEVSEDVIDTNSQKYREEHRTKGENKTENGGVYSDYTLYDENNNEIGKVDKGDISVVDKTYRGVPEYHLNDKKQLIGTPGSTISQGNDIIRLLEEAEKGNYVSSMAIVEGLSRLANVLNSNRSQEIVVSGEFAREIASRFNIEGGLGKKVNSEDYVYVPRKIRTRQDGEEPNRWLRGVGGLPTMHIYDNIVNDSRVELVKKSDLNPWDTPLDKKTPSQDLVALSEEDLQKITKALIGDNGKDTSLKNTNIELQNAMLKYFETHFSNTNAKDLGLGTFDTHMMKVQNYENLVEKQKSDLSEDWGKNRAHKAAQKVKDSKNQRNTNQETTTVTLGNESLDYKDKVKIAMDFFINELGLTKEKAAGFVANLDRESSLRPDAENGDAEGIAQWTNTGNRKSNLLEAFNKKYNTNYEKISKMSFDEQLRMLEIELTTGNKKKFFENYKNGKYDKLEPAEAVLRGFEFGGDGNLANPGQIHPDLEHPYEWHSDKRIKSAQAILASYSTPTQSVTPDSITFTGSNTDFNTITTNELNKTEGVTNIIDYSDKLYNIGNSINALHASLSVVEKVIVESNQNTANAVLATRQQVVVKDSSYTD